MRYRFDLHLHSYHSFDGVMAPRHMVALAKRRGLHGIAVTDHNSVRGGSAAFDLQCDDDFLVIPGTEIATDIGDILGLFVTEEIQSRQCTDVIAEMRALSTRNSEEIREAVEDGKRRLTKLIEQGSALALMPGK